jgi:hypothetical protein
MIGQDEPSRQAGGAFINSLLGLFATKWPFFPLWTLPVGVSKECPLGG